MLRACSIIVGVSPDHCDPQDNRSGDSPKRSRSARAPSTCSIWPLWLAQISDSSDGVNRKPGSRLVILSASASACNGFIAERGNTSRSTSPRPMTTLPSASHSATSTRWRLSSAPPRLTDTGRGSAENKGNETRGWGMAESVLFTRWRFRPSKRKRAAQSPPFLQNGLRPALEWIVFGFAAGIEEFLRDRKHNR